MSDFLLPRLQTLEPYIPGEQPQDRRYVKLNTNESPYPPSPRVLEALNREKISRLNLYPDPLALTLRETIAKEYGLAAENVFVGNGSDEVLGFAFLAYADEQHPVTIPEVSYGFYNVYSQLFRVEPIRVPLNKDFSIPVEKFCDSGTVVVLANPNAPTALALPLESIERIVASNLQHVVLVDEAYVDFGGESGLTLLSKYPNLLLVRTFSKSRSLAGARLGYALGGKALIEDLERVKGSFHPYSINSLTMAAGIEAIRDKPYFVNCVQSICAQREKTAEELRALGFSLTESKTNFLFAKPPRFSGRAYYEKLKEEGILVRYLSQAATKDYVRITIGTAEEMEWLVAKTKDILKEAGA